MLYDDSDGNCFFFHGSSFEEPSTAPKPLTDFEKTIDGPLDGQYIPTMLRGGRVPQLRILVRHK